MDCLINLLAVCVFNPSSVYLSGGLDVLLDKPDDERLARPCYVVAWCVRPRPSGPIGHLRLGVMVNATDSIVINYGLEHRSYINESDRGSEFAFLELTWRPFR